MAHGNVPVKHSAGKKSGTVPDLTGNFSKPQLGIEQKIAMSKR
jgi:hypothetical protein